MNPVGKEVPDDNGQEPERSEKVADETQGDSFIDIIKTRRMKKMNERKEIFRELLGLKENVTDESMAEHEKPEAENKESENNSSETEDAEPESS